MLRRFDIFVSEDIVLVGVRFGVYTHAKDTKQEQQLFNLLQSYRTFSGSRARLCPADT